MRGRRDRVPSQADYRLPSCDVRVAEAFCCGSLWALVAVTCAVRKSELSLPGLALGGAMNHIIVKGDSLCPIR